MFYYLCSSLFHRDTRIHTEKHNFKTNLIFLTTLFLLLSQITQQLHLKHKHILHVIYNCIIKRRRNEATHHKYKATFEDLIIFCPFKQTNRFKHERSIIKRDLTIDDGVDVVVNDFRKIQIECYIIINWLVIYYILNWISSSIRALTTTHKPCPTF